MMPREREASPRAYGVAKFSEDLTREICVMLNAIGATSGLEGMHNTIPAIWAQSEKGEQLQRLM